MKKSLIVILFLSILTSCSVFKQSWMLRTGNNYPYAEIPSTPNYEYKLANNDVIEFRIFSNNGFKLIDLTNFNTNVAGGVGRVTLDYLVEFDGTVKLPIVGRIKIAGKKLREAELYLEKIYAEHYNKPFVMLTVSNRRVIIFPGSGGGAKVIKLENNNTTVLEALAMAGGISTGKARKIKLIRGNPRNPDVYLINLSTIEGMKNADMVIQANDIIYVEPVLEVTKTILGELTPILSLLTTVLLLWTILNPAT